MPFTSSRPFTHRPRKSSHRRAVPVVEVLEDRSLPSATMVTHFAPGALTNYGAGVVFQNELFFTATISQTTGLYKSDGTAAGTVLVKTLAGGPDQGPQFTVVNNTLFFEWRGGLWKSDGTSAGTTVFSERSPRWLTSLNGTLYFVDFSDSGGPNPTSVLWKSDGTSAGTVEVNLPAAADEDVFGLTAGNGKLYYMTNGEEAVWQSDGTAAGTTPILPLGDHPVVGSLVAGNGEVYFLQLVAGSQGATTQNEFALEASDGSHTQQIGPDIAARYANDLALLNKQLYFLVTTPEALPLSQLWEADNSTAPTLIAGFAPGATSLWSIPDLTAYKGEVFFAGWDANHGVELWKTDGTAAGTALFKDINPGPANSEPPLDEGGALGIESSGWSYQMTGSGGKLFFTADDGTHGAELWQTDGTTAGTVMAADLDPGSQGSNPQNLINVNGSLFFTANDGTHGEQLWVLPSSVPAASSLTATGHPVAAQVGRPFSGLVATFTDSNPLPLASYTATINWGDGHTSAGTVAALGNGQFSVSGTNSYSHDGTDTVTVQINRAGGGSVTATTTATVAPVAAGNLIAATQGQAFTGVVGTFTDLGPSAATGDTATIHWGDGHTSAGTITAKGNGVFVVSGTNTYANGPASYPVVVNISLTGGRSAFALSAALVSSPNPGPSIKATEGQPFSGVVTTFTDLNPTASASADTATITWGDGHTSAGTVASLGNGRFSVSGGNTYAHAGLYKVSVLIDPAGGGRLTAPAAIAVADEPFWATRTFQHVEQGQPVTGVLGTLTDLNPLAASGDFTVTIDWGDGTKTPGLLLPTGKGTFNISGNHDYATAGVRTLAVTIKDEGGRTATASPLITVDPAPASILSASGRTITALEGQTFSGVVATFTDSRPQAAGAYPAAITWGDGQVTAGTVAALGNGHFSVSGSNVYAHAGTYTVSVEVTGRGGVSATAATTANVADEPFWVTRTFQRVTLGQPVTGTLGTLTDLNQSATAGDFKVAIDWGDGSKSSGLVLPSGKGTFDIAGSHTYASAGNETLTLTVTDEGGRTVTTDPIVTVDS